MEIKPRYQMKMQKEGDLFRFYLLHDHEHDRWELVYETNRIDNQDLNNLNVPFESLIRPVAELIKKYLIRETLERKVTNINLIYKD